MKTLKIEIPQGYEIDKEKSTFENIVFKLTKKELPKSWDELKWIKGFKVGEYNMIVNKKGATYNFNANLFATKEQAEASIALAQLSQLLAVYKDDEKTASSYFIKFYEDGEPYVFNMFVNQQMQSFLSFKDLGTAELFLTNFKDLILTAKPLL